MANPNMVNGNDFNVVRLPMPTMP